MDSNGSSHGNPIARPVANQIIRNGVSHDEAMLVVCCLLFLRASNDFHTFRETAEQEQQLAASMCTLAAIKLAAGCGLVQAARATCEMYARAEQKQQAVRFLICFLSSVSFSLPFTSHSSHSPTQHPAPHSYRFRPGYVVLKKALS